MPQPALPLNKHVVPLQAKRKPWRDSSKKPDTDLPPKKKDKGAVDTEGLDGEGSRAKQVEIEDYNVSRAEQVETEDGPVPVHLEERQITTDKSYLGGQVLTSFAADDISMKGKCYLEGQVHIPHATDCALARDKWQSLLNKSLRGRNSKEQEE
ncbi:hypothetical protein TNIN_63341 [Trichonephila inaurata madagascariensis]|uniref:Uncharacterized protein n=1 Tax=Trichonephila inaurata madagascariensis TaxID=2747483 RepID=A0A8X6IIY7_9ARAC|nr:hypothetical protein TNIN_63341 [Trichonephila inaurata madagascariensis]